MPIGSPRAFPRLRGERAFGAGRRWSIARDDPGLVNQEDEKTGIERHHGKQVTFVTAYPPGCVEVRKESYPEEDRRGQENEHGVKNAAEPDSAPMPNDDQQGGTPGHGHADDKTSVVTPDKVLQRF